MKTKEKKVHPMKTYIMQAKKDLSTADLRESRQLFQCELDILEGKLIRLAAEAAELKRNRIGLRAILEGFEVLFECR